MSVRVRCVCVLCICVRVCTGAEGPLLPREPLTMRAGRDLRDHLIQCPHGTGEKAEVRDMSLAHHHPSFLSPASISQRTH